jgi:hypothetical protein
MNFYSYSSIGYIKGSILPPMSPLRYPISAPATTLGQVIKIRFIRRSANKRATAAQAIAVLPVPALPIRKTTGSV